MALTVQHSYLGLLILRCFQSAGSSAMVALCQGIVADVATAADRGTYVAYASVSTILGPTLSPVIGGLLSQYFGWRAIFWFLAAFAAPVFALILLFLPETCHKIVGNGSIPSSSFYHMTLHEWFRGEKRLARDVGVSEEHEGLLTEKPSIKFPNPLTTLKILSNKEALLLMGFVGIVFGIHYLVLSTIPFRYGDMYEFGETQLGLIYVLRAGKYSFSIHNRQTSQLELQTARKTTRFPIIERKATRPDTLPDRTSATRNRPADSILQQRHHRPLRIVPEMAYTHPGNAHFTVLHRLWRLCAISNHRYPDHRPPPGNPGNSNRGQQPGPVLVRCRVHSVRRAFGRIVRCRSGLFVGCNHGVLDELCVVDSDNSWPTVEA